METTAYELRVIKEAEGSYRIVDPDVEPLSTIGMVRVFDDCVMFHSWIDHTPSFHATANEAFRAAGLQAGTVHFATI